MTEANARVLLRDCGGVDGVEPWLAEQPWQAVPGGWTIDNDPHGLQLRVDVVAGGLRISATTLGGSDPAIWVVMS